MTDSIEHVVIIAAPPSAVWNALTDASQLEQWYAPGCRWDVPALVPGGVVSFFNTETDVQRAHVEAAADSRELTLSWEILPDKPEIRIRNSFLLEPDGSATKVTISQSGYAALPAAEREASWRQDQEAVLAIANCLKSYVERSLSPSGSA
jgi:uncharacterized protein YndB with AHSA1/START domain